jgi:hypothetical protein
MLDCDPGVLLMVMNVIHGKNQEILKEEGEGMLRPLPYE